MKTHVIIGASSGIGKQLAKILAEAGDKVIGTYHKTQPDFDHSNIVYQRYDVLDPEVSADFLPEELNSLVYCPGSINLKPFRRIPPEDFTRDYELQLSGAVKMIQLAFKALRKSGNASVLLFSTVAVHTGFNFHSQVSASKGAIEGLTRALAAEFAPKIRVNCIAPSLTDTPLAASLLNSADKIQANAEKHPLKKIGHVQDIAGMAEFLLSEKAGWITGQIMHVDGGMSSIKT